MKILAYILIVVSLLALILGAISKFSAMLIGGIGPTGYLNISIVLLLFAANLTLLELLKK